MASASGISLGLLRVVFLELLSWSSVGLLIAKVSYLSFWSNLLRWACSRVRKRRARSEGVSES